MASLQNATVNELSVVGTNDVMPVGSMIPFFGSITPTGWLLCNGSAVSRTTYANLFTAIGEKHGSGDGSTTFNLPDFRGVVPLGKANSGTGSTYNETGGSFDHTHTGFSHAHGLSSHYHTVSHTHSIPTHTHNMEHTHTLTSHQHAMPHTHTIYSHNHIGTTNVPTATIDISTIGTRACATEDHRHDYSTNSVTADTGGVSTANTSNNLTSEVTNSMDLTLTGESVAGTTGEASITNSSSVTGYTSEDASTHESSDAPTRFVNYLIKY